MIIIQQISNNNHGLGCTRVASIDHFRQTSNHELNNGIINHGHLVAFYECYGFGQDPIMGFIVTY